MNFSVRRLSYFFTYQRLSISCYTNKAITPPRFLRMLQVITFSVGQSLECHRNLCSWLRNLQTDDIKAVILWANFLFHLPPATFFIHFIPESLPL